jgi:hypothetical protein
MSTKRKIGLGRRLELLVKMAAENIPPDRRKELISIVEEAIAPIATKGVNVEELFYAVMANAHITSLVYVEQMQAKMGLEILEENDLPETASSQEE